MRTAIVGLIVAVAAAVGPPAKKAVPVGPPPRLTGSLTPAVEAGKKTKVVLRGLNLEGVTSARAHEPKSRAVLVGRPKKAAVPNNQPAERVGDWEVEVEVEPAVEVPGGRVAVAVVGPGGESNTVRLAVFDGTPRVAEKEPNDGFDAAQELASPCVVTGSFHRDRDVDVYRVRGKAGQKLHASVLAARLGGPADAILTAYDDAGRVLDSCDDANGSADPELVVTLPRDGVYFLALIEAHDFGGPAFAYLLFVDISR